MGALIAAPALVKAESIMRVKPMLWRPRSYITLPDAVAGNVFSVFNNSSDETLDVMTSLREHIPINPKTVAEILCIGRKHIVICFSPCHVDSEITYGLMYGGNISMKLGNG